ncbi:MAG: carboxypeptidase regulatory-like domain-containing protein [Isosphaeraceae bacterium]
MLVSRLHRARSRRGYSYWGAWGGCCCCAATFTVSCGALLAGVTVGVSNTSGFNTSGVTGSGGQVTLTIPGGGDYTVTANGSSCSNYSAPMALACGGSYPIACCCTAIICVTDCPSGTELIGATVTIKSGSTTLGSCITADNGGNACCGIDIGTAGSYEVTVSATGYQTYTGTLSLTCNGTTTIALQPSTAPATIAFTVYGCCVSGVLAGATVTLSDGQSGVTDSTGQVSFWEGLPGTYTYSVTASRFATYTGSVTIVACSTTTANISVTMTPASGYACGPLDPNNDPRPEPISTTLYLTDSVYGACTLTFDTVNNCWFGTITGANYAAGCSCPASTFNIGYTLYPCGDAKVLAISVSLCTYGQCLDGGWYPSSNECPGTGTTALNPCTGQPNGYYFADCSDNPPTEGNVNAGGFVLPNAYYSGSSSWSIASGLPFDFSGTIPPCGCAQGPQGYSCTDNATGGNVGEYFFAWNGGGTITITE